MKKLFSNKFFLGLFWCFAGTGLFSCASTEKKPTRLMIYASAAMNAARNAGAERKAPDPFRKAESAMWRALTEYKRKRWSQAAQAAVLARRYAEQAELQAEVQSALSGGGGFY